MNLMYPNNNCLFVWLPNNHCKATVARLHVLSQKVKYKNCLVKQKIAIYLLKQQRLNLNYYKIIIL